MFLERLNKYNVNQTGLYEIEKQNKQVFFFVFFFCKKKKKKKTVYWSRLLLRDSFILGLAAL